MLNHLNWDVHLTTVLDIIQAYLVHGILDKQDLIKQTINSETRVLGTITRLSINTIMSKAGQICSNLSDWEL